MFDSNSHLQGNVSLKVWMLVLKYSLYAAFLKSFSTEGASQTTTTTLSPLSQVLLLFRELNLGSSQVISSAERWASVSSVTETIMWIPHLFQPRQPILAQIDTYTVEQKWTGCRGGNHSGYIYRVTLSQSLPCWTAMFLLAPDRTFHVFDVFCSIKTIQTGRQVQEFSVHCYTTGYH